jgi:hypothetical protein
VPRRSWFDDRSEITRLSPIAGDQWVALHTLVKWEYANIAISDERANALGNDGWELVAFDNRGNGMDAYFKRPKR